MSRGRFKNLFLELVASRGDRMLLIFFSGISLYLLLCLIPSYGSPPAWVGEFGAEVGENLRSAFGWEAWLIPLGLGWLSWAAGWGWFSPLSAGRGRKAGGLGLAAFSVLALGGLLGPAVAGKAGAALAAGLRSGLGSGGSLVLLVVLGLASLFLLDWEEAFFRGLKAGLQILRDRLPGVGRATADGVLRIKAWVAGWRSSSNAVSDPPSHPAGGVAGQSPAPVWWKKEEVPESPAEEEEPVAEGTAPVGGDEAKADDPAEISELGAADAEGKEARPRKKRARARLKAPSLDLLSTPQTVDKRSEANLSSVQSQLMETLRTFGIQAEPLAIVPGPSVTRFEIRPAPGVKVSRFNALADDIALALEAAPVRVVAPIPGKAAVGIEIPNRNRAMVSLRAVLGSGPRNEGGGPLRFAVGLNMGGESVVADLADMPHLLVGGATGSGKSAFINSLLCSMLFSSDPKRLRFLLVDPKRVELTPYAGMPHLLCPVVTEPKKAARALRRLVSEMERRYVKLAEAGVRNLQAYWEKVEPADPEAEILPAIVVVIDELADLMLVAANEVEDAIARLAQMARGVGIHLVFATQNPAVTVITGTIKANFPSRIAFRVPSMVNSRTILDTNGAESLLGRGDMLYHPAGAPKPERIQGCFVTTEDVKALVGHWRDQAETEYLMEGLAEAETVEGEINEATGIDPNDAQYIEAKRIVIQTQVASTSLLQRRISIGYGKAARLLDQMEREGLVGPPRGSRPREVLVKTLESSPGRGEGEGPEREGEGRAPR